MNVFMDREGREHSEALPADVALEGTLVLLKKGWLDLAENKQGWLDIAENKHGPLDLRLRSE